MKVISIRIEDDVLEMLDHLCAVTNTKRPALLETMIRSEHDRLQGNPKLKAILEQMRVLEEKLKDVAKQ